MCRIWEFKDNYCKSDVGEKLAGKCCEIYRNGGVDSERQTNENKVSNHAKGMVVDSRASLEVSSQPHCHHCLVINDGPRIDVEVWVVCIFVRQDTQTALHKP